MNATDDLAEFLTGMRDGAKDHIRGNHYEPCVPVCADNAAYLDGYSGGWQAGDKASRAHTYTVTTSGGHGYPYRATCPCGWQSTTYAAAHAAHTMGEEHVTAEAMETINRANRAK